MVSHYEPQHNKTTKWQVLPVKTEISLVNIFAMYLVAYAIVFLFFVLPIFSQQVRVGGRNKNKIHSDHFPIELKSKETQNCVSFDFNSIGKWSK